MLKLNQCTRWKFVQLYWFGKNFLTCEFKRAQRTIDQVFKLIIKTLDFITLNFLIIVTHSSPYFFMNWNKKKNHYFSEKTNMRAKKKGLKWIRKQTFILWHLHNGTFSNYCTKNYLNSLHYVTICKIILLNFIAPTSWKAVRISLNDKLKSYITYLSYRLECKNRKKCDILLQLK